MTIIHGSNYSEFSDRQIIQNDMKQFITFLLELKRGEIQFQSKKSERIESLLTCLPYIACAVEELLEKQGPRVKLSETEQPKDSTHNRSNDKISFINGIITQSIECFDNEYGRFTALRQTKRVLRDQIWNIFPDNSKQRKLITLIINAVNGSIAKNLTVEQMETFLRAVNLLKKRDTTNDIISEMEESLLQIGL